MSKRRLTFKFFDSIEDVYSFVRSNRIKSYDTTPWSSGDKTESKIVLWYKA